MLTMTLSTLTSQIKRPQHWVTSLLAMFISSVLCGSYALSDTALAWIFGFVMLVPWLRALDAQTSLGRTLLCAWAMTVGFTAAIFAWFGLAIGNYTQMGASSGLALLLLGAPLFQPQLLAFALARFWVTRRHGKLLGAWAGAAAWVASEWLLPKLLGDTLGHGLYPSRVLRQAADLGGAALLTLVLLLCNQAIAHALALRFQGWRACTRPLLLVATLPLLLALYGLAVLPDEAKPEAKIEAKNQANATTANATTANATTANTPTQQTNLLRIGLIQSNLVDYERQRQQHGAYPVVRQILDTHFAMSYDAVVRQHADAVLWSETSYPTTFGHPKSEAGAELDQSILSIVNSAGVPFVFGTYDRDAGGEYNAAAFVLPGSGLLGFYRKTRLFPFTEYVPAWLDSPPLRRALPWTGNWLAGNGARVFPLRLADGREIPVLPLICRDDVDTSLGIAGARLGAQAILTMSNDAWFSSYPQGARLHQAVAAFRSIETRLPQFRVTSNGFSGVIDATGSISAASRMGQQTLVMGALPVQPVARTLMVVWGDWVGLVALIWLALLAGMALGQGIEQRISSAMAASPFWRRFLPHEASSAPVFPLRVAVLPPAARIAAAVLRSLARLSLLWLALLLWQNDALRGNTLAQIRLFTGWFLLPEAASWCVVLAFSARASIESGKLVLSQGSRRMELALHEITAFEIWRIPLPGPGVTLTVTSSQRWQYHLACANPAALAQALALAGGITSAPPSPVSLYQQARMAMRRGRLDQAWLKFLLLPLALALPAYYLHQHIAYGSGFGEYSAFGLKAWASGLALWWAAWAIGVTLCGSVLRLLIEVGTLLALLLRAQNVVALRRWFERAGHIALYLGLPGWLLMRVFGS
ncbi:MAG: apolipoprotein N-acyltransferase [Pseudomonadota bacterium]